MTYFTSTHANALGWLLDSELGSLNGVKCAVLISSDGLLFSRSASLTQEEGEKLSAMGSGFLAIAREYDKYSDGGGVRQVLVELDAHICLIGQAGTNMLLMVETSGPDADVATIAQQMAALAQRVGHEMAVADRQPGEAPRT